MGELFSLRAGEKDVADESTIAEVEESEPNDAWSFVGSAFRAVDETGDIFAGAYNEDLGKRHR